MELNVNVDLDVLLVYVAANVANIAIVSNAVGIFLAVMELIQISVVVAAKIYHYFAILFIKDGIKNKCKDNNKEKISKN